MKSTKTLLAALALSSALFGAAASPSYAGPEVNTAIGGVIVGGKPAPGLAVHGFDPVAFFTDSKPVQGDANFATTYKEATYRFASQEHLDAFKADPAKYVPAYGGYCAFGVSVGKKFDGDPRFWSIVNGKLYLNLDKGIAETFAKDVPGNLKKAEANWPGIEAKLPSEIK